MSGYTPVPNDVLDRLMAELDPYTFKVYLYIIRQTTGWHRTACQISVTQFQQATAIAKRNVIVAAVANLEAMRLIRTTTAPGVTTSYQLVTDGYRPLVTPGYRSPVTVGYATKERGKKGVREKDREAWDATLVRLQGMMSAANFATYVAGLALVACSPTALTLRAPSAYVAGVVRTRWLAVIQKAWGPAIEITVVDRLSEQEAAG